VQVIQIMQVAEGTTWVPLRWFLQRLEGVGKRGSWLWKQILFWMACLIEGQLLSATDEEPQRIPEAGSGAEEEEKDKKDDIFLEEDRARQKKKRKMKGVYLLRPQAWQICDEKRATCQYFFAAREAFKDCLMLHIGVDAADVGGVSRMLGYLTLPRGIGCWAAPTDLLSNSCVF
jgi:hypothetical protein